MRADVDPVSRLSVGSGAPPFYAFTHLDTCALRVSITY